MNLSLFFFDLYDIMRKEIKRGIKQMTIKKKKIVITLVVIIIVLITAVGYILVKDLIQESKLKKELTELSLIANAEIIDKTEVDKKLETIVTEGDYAILEKAMKQYLSDVFANAVKVREILEDKRIEGILTASNYKEDGPDFIVTKQYIQETTDNLIQLKENLTQSFTQEKIMSYIEGKNLDTYYTDLYKELALSDETTQQDEEQIAEALDSVIELLNKEEAVIDFLIAHKGEWQVQEDNTISFRSNNLTNQYNDLLALVVE